MAGAFHSMAKTCVHCLRVDACLCVFKGLIVASQTAFSFWFHVFLKNHTKPLEVTQTLQNPCRKIGKERCLLPSCQPLCVISQPAAGVLSYQQDAFIAAEHTSPFAHNMVLSHGT